jgi:molecular chaperone DnaK
MSRAQQPSDRRRFTRVPLDLLIQYRFESFDAFMSEYAADVSVGGMFVRTRDPRPIGTMIYLQFTLKDGIRLIEALGKVVRVVSGGDEPGMGIEFVNLDEDSREMVEAIVRERGSPGADTDDLILS